MKKQKIPMNCGSDHNVEICLGESDPYCYHKLYLKSRFCSTCHLRCTWTCPRNGTPFTTPFRWERACPQWSLSWWGCTGSWTFRLLITSTKSLTLQALLLFLTDDSVLQTQLQHPQSAPSDKRWLWGAWTTSGSVNVSGFVCSVNTLCLPLAEGEHSAV